MIKLWINTFKLISIASSASSAYVLITSNLQVKTNIILIVVIIVSILLAISIEGFYGLRSQLAHKDLGKDLKQTNRRAIHKSNMRAFYVALLLQLTTFAGGVYYNSMNTFYWVKEDSKNTFIKNNMSNMNKNIESQINLRNKLYSEIGKSDQVKKESLLYAKKEYKIKIDQIKRNWKERLKEYKKTKNIEIAKLKKWKKIEYKKYSNYIDNYKTLNVKYEKRLKEINNRYEDKLKIYQNEISKITLNVNPILVKEQYLKSINENINKITTRINNLRDQYEKENKKIKSTIFNLDLFLYSFIIAIIFVIVQYYLYITEIDVKNQIKKPVDHELKGVTKSEKITNIINKLQSDELELLEYLLRLDKIPPVKTLNEMFGSGTTLRFRRKLKGILYNTSKGSKPELIKANKEILIKELQKVKS